MNICIKNIKNIKNSKAALIVLLIFVVFIACTPEGSRKSVSALDTILETGVLKVGTTGDWNPMSVIDPNTGEYFGHDIDLVTQLAEDMGVELEFVKTDWKSLVAGISANRYHISTSASFNMGRAKTVGYTLPVGGVYTVAVVQKEQENRFKQWQDLNAPQVSVAITLGTVFDETASTFLPRANIIKVEAPARDFQEVLAKKADVSITSNIEAGRLKNEYPDQLAILDDPFPSKNYLGLLTPRDDYVFINYLNVWIQMKQQSGFLDELQEKWLR